MLRKLRQEGCRTPIMLLTAKAEIEDRVVGLDLGELAQKMAEPFREPLALRGITLRMELPGVSPEALFERFRRGDEARTRKKGGYGIGLAVAKACAEANGGSIRAIYEGSDRICFEILFETIPSA